MTERIYLFNPFTIRDTPNDELQATYSNLHQQINADAETPYQIARNIELYSNMNFIVVEMIARYTEEVNLLKADIQSREAREVYIQRKAWVENEDERAPAMAYFQSLARDKLRVEYSNLARMESNLKRFKGAYDSIEAKQNAMKKLIDGIKYET